MTPIKKTVHYIFIAGENKVNSPFKLDYKSEVQEIQIVTLEIFTLYVFCLNQVRISMEI